MYLIIVKMKVIKALTKALQKLFNKLQVWDYFLKL